MKFLLMIPVGACLLFGLFLFVPEAFVQHGGWVALAFGIGYIYLCLVVGRGILLDYNPRDGRSWMLWWWK